MLLPDGTKREIPDPPVEPSSATAPNGPTARSGRSVDGSEMAGEPTTRVPLGTVCGARSGDKGGNANVGLWCDTDDAYRWLTGFLTTERLRLLLPEIRAPPRSSATSSAPCSP